jgi:hypothetical protein
MHEKGPGADPGHESEKVGAIRGGNVGDCVREGVACSGQACICLVVGAQLIP